MESFAAPTPSATSNQQGATEAYPRVLVVNMRPFFQGDATGLTISRLFQGWPSDRLACLFTRPVVPDWRICDRYWRISEKELRYARHLIRRSPPAAPLQPVPDDVDISSSSYAHQKPLSLPRRLAHSIMNRQNIWQLDTYRLPNFIMQEIEEYAPQVIYTMLGSNSLMHIVIEVAERLQIPVVPHFTDDWPTTLYKTSIFRPILRYQMHERLKRILSHSSTRLAIGDEMVAEYTKRYGGKFLAFMNTVEPHHLAQLPTPLPHRKTLKFVYSGGLHLDRGCSLQEIANVLLELRTEGLEADIEIYTQPVNHALAAKLNMPPVMRFAGTLTPEESFAKIHEADVLLHVESFDKAHRTYTRYSVSTKIPEYMASGRPIFAYGPAEIASIRYVQNSGAGLAVGEQKQSALMEALRTLITSPELRESMGAQGRAIACQRHDAAKNREEFQQILRQVATQQQGVAS